MKITAQEEYGLRCLLQLARHQGSDTLTVGRIAEAEGLSIPYVGKLLSALRQGGLVESVRGRSGGFGLSRPAHRISVAQALRALGGQLFEPEFCAEHPGTNEVCVHLGRCSIQSLWSVIGNLVDQVLSATTLADLTDGTDASRRLEAVGQELQTLLAAPKLAGGVPVQLSRPPSSTEETVE